MAGLGHSYALATHEGSQMIRHIHALLCRLVVTFILLIACPSSADDALLVSEGVRARVSAHTGELTSFVYQGREMLSAPARLVLSVRNAASGRRTELAPGEVTGFRAGPTTVHYVRKWEQARVEVTIELKDGGLTWSAASSGPAPTREATVEYVLPCLRDMDRVFWAAIGAPFSAADKPTGFRYPYQSVLPLATAYRRVADIGLSVIAPLELRKPELSVKLDWGSGAIRFVNAHLRLGEPWQAKTGLWLVPHAGCWRPGLAWLLRRYPDYFESCARVLESEGYYEGCWLRGATMDDPKERKSREVTWVESHSFWPIYGVYVPDKDPWRIIPSLRRKTPADLATWERGEEPGRVMSRQWIRDYIRAYHDQGIQYYAYANTTEAWLHYANKYFPDSIVYRLKAPDYGGMAIVNAYEGTSWGKHIREQVRRTVECYPEQDGLFLDQNCYRAWHFGADDGVSMVNGKLCSQMSFAQEQMLAFMHRLTAPRKMGIWTNYARVGVECCRYVHGVMSESLRPRPQDLQYLCLARPLVICTGDRGARGNEERFKSCLACGAFPPARWNKSKLTQRVLAKYKPLNDLLKGRRWVLHAHALELPSHTEGNIFKIPNGDYLVPFITPEATQLSRRSPFRHNLPVTVRVPDADLIKHAYLRSGDYFGPGELAMERKGDSIRMLVPAHLASTMIVLTRRDEHQVVRLTSPVLVRGQSTRVSFAIRDVRQSDSVTLRTPWGRHSAEAKRQARDVNVVDFTVVVPADAHPAEVDLRISINTPPSAIEEIFTAWIEPPVTLNSRKSVFVKSTESALPATALSHTSHPVDVTFTTEPPGILLPPRAVRLAPHESRRIVIPAEPVERATRVRLRAHVGQETLLNRLIKVSVPRAQRLEDLHHEPFRGPGLAGWQIQCGEWSCADGTAAARGPAHWATLPWPAWRDYGLQLTVKMDGSTDPTRPWIKCYVFIRMDGTSSFARFGFTGQRRTPEGFTRVAIDRCHKGQYVGSITDGRFPYRSGRWYVLRIEVRGRRARGYVDDQLMIDVKLPDEVPDAGGIGIGVQEDSMVNHYRDLIVYPLDEEASDVSGPPEPVGAWSFDDGLAEFVATDDSGSDFDGEVSGCAAAPGMVGKAARLDGNNSYIMIRGHRAFWTPSFTFAAWVKPETFAPNDKNPGVIVFSMYNTWRGPALILSRKDGTPTLMLRYGPGKSFDLRSPQPIPLNQWTHLAASYDAAVKRASLYINGDPVASATGDSHPGKGHSLVLGKWFHCDAAHFTGTLDDVVWFDKAIGLEDVAGLFRRGADGK